MNKIKNKNPSETLPDKNLPESLDTMSEEEFFPIRQRLKPGPQGEDYLLSVDQDLKDAALIIELVEKGHLETKLPKRDSSKDHIYLSGKNRISAEEELLLAQRVQKYGDIDARNCLVMSNLGLVHLVANQFYRAPVRYEDLVQEGTLGLLRATETFESNRGVRFSTYSVYWIRAKIQRFLQKIDRDDVPIISGAHMHEDEYGRKKRPRARKISIENTFDDESARNLNEVIATSVQDPESIALKIEKTKVIERILYGIVDELGDYRMKVVIENRVLAEDPETLSKVGRRLNLSREGARLLEAKLLKIAKNRLKKWKR